MNTNGNNYSLLHTFATNSPGAWNPSSPLIQGKDGMLYGTTTFGGSAYYYGGTLFKLNTNGAGFITLHDFPTITGDGYNPNSIIQASDGFPTARQ